MNQHLAPVGLISVGTPWFDVATANSNLRKTWSTLEASYRLVGPQHFITSQEELGAAIEQFKREDIGALIIQIGTFPDGDFPARLAENLKVPFIVHSLPEPNLQTRIGLNSLCGANMTTFTLTALGHPHLFVHGDPTQLAVARQLDSYLKGALASKALVGTRIGLFGFRAPGFYPCSFDELLLRKKLGIAVEYVDLQQIVAALDQGVRKTAPSQEFPCIEGGHLQPEAVAWIERYYGALSSAIENSGYSTIAIRDWPEIEHFDANIPGGMWPALGWVQDDGIDLAPEGDVNGAATMALIRNITQGASFFADISAFDEAESTLLLWHYGGAPSLAQDPKGIRYGAEGREVEFTLKPGVATLVRLGLFQNQFRLLSIGVEVTDKATTLRRAAGWAKTMYTPAQQVVGELLDQGWEHHVMLAYGDLRESLRAFAKLAGIPYLSL